MQKMFHLGIFGEGKAFGQTVWPDKSIPQKLVENAKNEWDILRNFKTMWAEILPLFHVGSRADKISEYYALLRH